MKITDGKKTVEIRMMVWNGTGYDPDRSADFFSAGSLLFDPITEAYVVPDVDYCISQAEDWKNSTGDFFEAPRNENNTVIIDEIKKGELPMEDATRYTAVIEANDGIHLFHKTISDPTGEYEDFEVAMEHKADDLDGELHCIYAAEDVVEDTDLD